MIVLSGAAVVLPDRILSPGTIVIENDRIAEIRPDVPSSGAHSLFAFHGHYVVPGFIDVHVHGVDGVDSLDIVEGGAITAIAGRLPRYGVTAFCPTTVACSPEAMRRVLAEVAVARKARSVHAARVLPAHLESNFLNPEYAGAQNAVCLRSPGAAVRSSSPRIARGERREDFGAADVLTEIERGAPDVGIVTVAPELDGGLDLVRWLVDRGHRVGLGHSGASYELALDAITAGARHATHLFNRMPPLHHRAPGLAGAVLQTDEVAAELICDGFHVHPALVRTAIAAKHPSRIFAISDGTAAAGLRGGGRASLGGRSIHAGESAAFLEDGTLAGSVCTMDRVFRTLVGPIGIPLVDAAIVCATTPARELGLVGHGVLAAGEVADLVVLDQQFEVVQTYIGGQLAYARNAP
jgi:N-acetylglucosamine-6-phosphate deacetylase